MKDAIKIGLAGAGTVGGGVIKILAKEIGFFRNKLQLPLELTKIATLDPQRLKDFPTGKAEILSDGLEIASAPDIDIVIELIGGTTAAKEIVLKAIENEKHVITANKKLIAEHGPEIFAAADKKNVSVYFEAAVGGGMPTIKTARESLIGNNTMSFYGIINGTCNYILTKMTEEGSNFNETLKNAQKLGYAEADPTLDIDGGDTGHKIAIMASLLFDGFVDYNKMQIEGIRNITCDDIKFAKELGYKIKLLGIAKKRAHDKSIDIRVNPVMLPENHILANVRDVFNAALFTGDAVGDIMLYGKGAGELPTASAVISDIVDVARNIISDNSKRIPMRTYSRENEITLKTSKEITSRFYLRFSVKDKPGVIGIIATTLGNHNVSISSIDQSERHDDDFVPIIFTTDEANEQDIKNAVAEIEKNSFIKATTQFIRIEDN
ncbi:MAG: homoserine dehydrogenase [Chitinivibrionia bacterium]|nr:homoserine dehydrogenase [Chitinivibrionia bacterium]